MPHLNGVESARHLLPGLLPVRGIPRSDAATEAESMSQTAGDLDPSFRLDPQGSCGGGWAWCLSPERGVLCTTRVLCLVGWGGGTH